MATNISNDIKADDVNSVVITARARYLNQSRRFGT